MDVQEHIKQLEDDGYGNIQELNFEAGKDLGEHTHEQPTAHIILKGSIDVTEDGETVTYKEGDRIEIPAGTTHSVIVGSEPLHMINGYK